MRSFGQDISDAIVRSGFADEAEVVMEFGATREVVDAEDDCFNTDDRHCISSNEISSVFLRVTLKIGAPRATHR